MAWDTAKTKQLLLDAAVQEFAEHGPQGARVDRIAKLAGVNKERIYQYFGNKEQLFGHVLDQELARVMAAVSPDPKESADLGEYAGRLYDWHTENPTFLRLLRWEGLQSEDGPTVREAERAAHYAAKIETLARAQQAGTVTDEMAPQHLLYATYALAAWWFAVPRVIAMIMAGMPDDGPQAHRAALVQLVRRLG